MLKWKGKGLWVTKISRNGRTFEKSTKTTNRREAEAILKQRLKEDDDTPRQFRKLDCNGLHEDLVVEYLVNDRKSIKHLNLRWRLHLRPVFGNLLAAKVKSIDITNYIDKRKQEGGANASINRELAILRRMFSLALENEKVKTPPRIRMLEEKNTRVGFLSSKDRDALAQACSGAGLWMRTIFEIGVTLGWRRSELINLRVRQVDLSAGSIRLEPLSTKNSEGRECPMTPTIRRLLTECVRGKAPGDRVFTRENGSPVLDFRSTWDRCCAEAGVPQLLFHDLRRSATRNLRNSGVPEGVVQKIGGWRTRSMFDRYSIIDQSDVTDALLKLERHRETETLKRAAEQAGQEQDQEHQP